MSCAGYAPLLVSTAQDAVLDTIVASAGPGTVAVLDLDGCLFDNRPRQVQIIHEFAAHTDQVDLAVVELSHFSDWSLTTTLRAAGLSAERVAQVIVPLRAFWEQRFFTSEYVRHDLPMPGAVRLVRQLQRGGAYIAYLTGRDDVMYAGSVETLCRFGFPQPGDGATLLCKPDAALSDDAWKRDALDLVRQLGKATLFMDNEPVNANLFADACLDALVVFVSTDHSPRTDRPHPDLPVIRGFLRTDDR